MSSLRLALKASMQDLRTQPNTQPQEAAGSSREPKNTSRKASDAADEDIEDAKSTQHPRSPRARPSPGHADAAPTSADHSELSRVTSALPKPRPKDKALPPKSPAPSKHDNSAPRKIRYGDGAQHITPRDRSPPSPKENGVRRSILSTDFTDPLVQDAAYRDGDHARSSSPKALPEPVRTAVNQLSRDRVSQAPLVEPSDTSVPLDPQSVPVQANPHKESRHMISSSVQPRTQASGMSVCKQSSSESIVSIQSPIVPTEGQQQHPGNNVSDQGIVEAETTKEAQRVSSLDSCEGITYDYEQPRSAAEVSLSEDCASAQETAILVEQTICDSDSTTMHDTGISAIVAPQHEPEHHDLATGLLNEASATTQSTSFNSTEDDKNSLVSQVRNSLNLGASKPEGSCTQTDEENQPVVLESVAHLENEMGIQPLVDTPQPPDTRTYSDEVAPFMPRNPCSSPLRIQLPPHTADSSEADSSLTPVEATLLARKQDESDDEDSRDDSSEKEVAASSPRANRGEDDSADDTKKSSNEKKTSRTRKTKLTSGRRAKRSSKSQRTNGPEPAESTVPVRVSRTAAIVAKTKLTSRTPRAASIEECTKISSPKATAQESSSTVKSKGEISHESLGNVSASKLPENEVNWVCCDKCAKWRRIPRFVDVSSLPEKWFCTMNSWDTERQSCAAPEEKYPADSNPLPEIESRPDKPSEPIELKDDSAPQEELPSAQTPFKSSSRVRSNKRKRPVKVTTEISTVPSVDVDDEDTECMPVSVTDKDIPLQKRSRTPSIGGKPQPFSAGVVAPAVQEPLPVIESIDWVMCNKCKKWRKVSSTVDLKAFPDDWFCSMNTWDLQRANCDAAEEADEPPPQKMTDAKSLRAPRRRVENVPGAVVESGVPPIQKVVRLWVQCERPNCKKWRRLPAGMDPNQLPEKWYCQMNSWEADKASCDAPEDSDSDPDGAPRTSSRSVHLILKDAKGPGALSYRRLIFGADGKIRAAFSEKNPTGYGLFSYTETYKPTDTNDEYIEPTRRVGYWWSCMYDHEKGVTDAMRRVTARAERVRGSKTGKKGRGGRKKGVKRKTKSNENDAAEDEEDEEGPEAEAEEPTGEDAPNEEEQEELHDSTPHVVISNIDEAFAPMKVNKESTDEHRSTLQAAQRQQQESKTRECSERHDCELIVPASAADTETKRGAAIQISIPESHLADDAMHLNQSQLVHSSTSAAQATATNCLTHERCAEGMQVKSSASQRSRLGSGPPQVQQGDSNRETKAVKRANSAQSAAEPRPTIHDSAGTTALCDELVLLPSTPAYDLVRMSHRVANSHQQHQAPPSQFSGSLLKRQRIQRGIVECLVEHGAGTTSTGPGAGVGVGPAARTEQQLREELQKMRFLDERFEHCKSSLDPIQFRAYVRELELAGKAEVTYTPSGELLIKDRTKSTPAGHGQMLGLAPASAVPERWSHKGPLKLRKAKHRRVS